MRNCAAFWSKIDIRVNHLREETLMAYNSKARRSARENFQNYRQNFKLECESECCSRIDEENRGVNVKQFFVIDRVLDTKSAVYYRTDINCALTPKVILSTLLVLIRCASWCLERNCLAMAGPQIVSVR